MSFRFRTIPFPQNSDWNASRMTLPWLYYSGYVYHGRRNDQDMIWRSIQTCISRSWSIESYWSVRTGWINSPYDQVETWNAIQENSINFDDWGWYAAEPTRYIAWDDNWREGSHLS